MCCMTVVSGSGNVRMSIYTQDSDRSEDNVRCADHTGQLRDALNGEVGGTPTEVCAVQFVQVQLVHTDDPRIEPTNNRAERALRGAVIARKVSQCSKTDEGAEAFSAFTSVIRTLTRKVDDDTLVDALCDVFSDVPRSGFAHSDSLPQTR